MPDPTGSKMKEENSARKLNSPFDPFETEREDLKFDSNVFMDSSFSHQIKNNKDINEYFSSNLNEKDPQLSPIEPFRLLPIKDSTAKSRRERKNAIPNHPQNPNVVRRLDLTVSKDSSNQRRNKSSRKREKHEKRDSREEVIAAFEPNTGGATAFQKDCVNEKTNIISPDDSKAVQGTNVGDRMDANSDRINAPFTISPKHENIEVLRESTQNDPLPSGYNMLLSHSVSDDASESQPPNPQNDEFQFQHEFPDIGEEKKSNTEDTILISFDVHSSGRIGIKQSPTFGMHSLEIDDDENNNSCHEISSESVHEFELVHLDQIQLKEEFKGKDILQLGKNDGRENIIWLDESPAVSLEPYFDAVSNIDRKDGVCQGEIKNDTEDDWKTTSCSKHIRQSILFNLEDAIMFDAGFCLSVGSLQFDGSCHERVKNTLERMIQNSMDFATLTGSINASKESILKIEERIHMLQNVMVKKIKSRQYEDSLLLLHRILAVFREYPKHLVSGTIFHNIGIVHLLNGDNKKALTAFTRAVKIRKHAAGVTHLDMLNSMSMVSLGVYALGHFSHAESILKEAITAAKSVLGASHPKLGEMYNNLAATYFAQDRVGKALEFFELSYEIQLQVLRETSYSPWDHAHGKNARKMRLTSIATTVANVGITQIHLREYEIAISALEDTLQNQYLVLDPCDPLVLSTLDNLAVANIEIQEFDKSFKIYSNTLHILTQKYGQYHFECASVWRKVSEVHVRIGHYLRALKCLQIMICCFGKCDKKKEDFVYYTKFKELAWEGKLQKDRIQTALDLLRTTTNSTLASF